MKTTLRLLLTIAIIHLGYSHAQAPNSSMDPSGIPTVRTGIVLASDVSNRWALVSGNEFFSLRGNLKELEKYERRRVTIKGSVDAEKRLTVRSIESSEMPEKQMRALVEMLRNDDWATPVNISNPTFWQFNFTDPMRQILEAGPGAQPVLLQYLDDPKIKDRVIILLGGIGDERAIGPIIRAMAGKNVEREQARKINLVANLALTNITVSDVIWHHGGGLTRDACPDDPQSCWNAWWLRNKDSFRVPMSYVRNYSNYPNYGIYRQP